MCIILFDNNIQCITQYSLRQFAFFLFFFLNVLNHLFLFVFVFCFCGVGAAGVLVGHPFDTVKVSHL